MDQLRDILLKAIRLDPLTKAGAMKNWIVIVGVVLCFLVIIYSNLKYDSKMMELNTLSKEYKVQQAIYLKWKSKNAQYRLESNIHKSVKFSGLKPSKYPPNRIIIRE